MGKANSEANGNGNGGGKFIPADCVSVLLMALGNTSISNTQYEMMSALDGTRTASAFQHQFRSILQKAKELKTRSENGEKFIPVTPGKKRGAAAMDGNLTPPDTPKKPKAAPKPRVKKSKAKVEEEDSPTNELNNGDAFANGVDELIKKEQAYDEEFA